MRLRSILKKFTKIIVIFLVAVIQLSFISALPGIFSYFNLIALTLVLFLILYDLKIAFYLALFFGFLSDIHSSIFFGLNIICWILAIIITNFFLLRFFTNKSIYSFISLTIITIIFYELPKVFLLFSIDFIIKDTPRQIIIIKDYFLNISQEILINAVVMFILFYFINYFSKRLQPVFGKRAVTNQNNL